MTTCRGVYAEYAPFFYRNLRIRLTRSQAIEPRRRHILDRVHHVEIIDDCVGLDRELSYIPGYPMVESASTSWLQRPIGYRGLCMDFLRFVSQLPNMKSVTIDMSKLADAAAYLENRGSPRELLETQLGTSLTCTGVGTFKFTAPELLPKVVFQHSLMLDLWPTVVQRHMLPQPTLSDTTPIVTFPTACTGRLATFLQNYTLLGLESQDWGWVHVYPTPRSSGAQRAAPPHPLPPHAPRLSRTDEDPVYNPPHGVLVRRPKPDPDPNPPSEEDSQEVKYPRVDIYSSLTAPDPAIEEGPSDTLTEAIDPVPYPAIQECLSDLLTEAIRTAQEKLNFRDDMVMFLEEDTSADNITAFVSGCDCPICSRLEYMGDLRSLQIV